MLYHITEQLIDTGEILRKIQSDATGAIATFHGIVRRPSRGRDVLYLEYTSYESMAVKVLEQIGSEICAKWEVEDVAIVHRTGTLDVGDTTIFIAIAARHRKAALEGCSYAIERIKQILPVWKKEVWEGGEEWIQGA